jgi:hypothetical protein
VTASEPNPNYMWPYQPGFRAMVEIEAETLLDQTGFNGYPEVWLIGFPVTESHSARICIEPDEGIYLPSELDAIPARATILYQKHPEYGMYYGDPTSREEQPARLRDEMRATAI